MWEILSYQFTVERRYRTCWRTLTGIRSFQHAITEAKKGLKFCVFQSHPSPYTRITWDVRRDGKWHPFWVWTLHDHFPFIERMQPTERFDWPGDAATAADWLHNGFPDMRKEGTCYIR